MSSLLRYRCDPQERGEAEAAARRNGGNVRMLRATCLGVLVAVSAAAADSSIPHLRRQGRALAWPAAASGEPPLLHPLFADHAVLQRERPIDVWGIAPPGDEATVTLAGARAAAQADAAGRWKAQLPALRAGGPHELVARAASGAAQTVRDLLVGDVWLCSGQSNMVLPVSRSLSASREIAGSANDRIRAVTIPLASGATPLDTFPSPLDWKAADPASTGS